MSDFFEELSKCTLKRDEQTLFYTLGRSDLNRLFCVYNRAALNPNQESVSALSVAVYLFGLLGINIENFTSIPAGYLASFGKDENVCTLLINESTLSIVRDMVIRFCDLKVNNNGDFYVFMKNLLSDKSKSLLAICFELNDYVVNNELDDILIKIDVALKTYDTLNQTNCDNNHKILRSCIEQNDDQKYDEILNGFILPGYLKYRGKDREGNTIPQNSQIINSITRIEELLSILSEENSNIDYDNQSNLYPKVVAILNMCSMDYTADMAYELLKRLKEFSTSKIEFDYEEFSKKMVQECIPATPNNAQEKSNVRNHYYGRL